MNAVSYHISLPQFEGPFDLLLFFIERDELDIYNIPITKLTNDFLDYIHTEKELNIELSSEFILFAATLMRIKAKLLLPRKEVDNAGNELDPRQELVDKILEYKKYKQAAAEMAELEAVRLLMLKRGNLKEELTAIGEASGEGTEIQAITMYKLMKAFEKVIQRIKERELKPMHTVIRYNYTMEESRGFLADLISKEKKVHFQTIFAECKDRIHAIFLLLSLLELVQQQYTFLTTGEGWNNFTVEWNEERQEETTTMIA